MDSKETTLTPLDHIPADIVCASDYEQLAPSFIAADRFAYIAGGSGHDVTLHKNREVFADFSLVPRLFHDVSSGNTQLNLLGKTLTHPVLLAPVAYQALVHSEAEIATAYAAESTDTCMVVSTLSSATLERVAKRAGQERWFQLYFQARDEDTFALVHRAAQAGYRAIVVTLDAAVQTPSIRAMRAGFRLPNDILPANLIHQQASEPPAMPAGQNHIFQCYAQHTLTRQQLKKLIEVSPLPVLVKGVLDAGDAGELKALGVAGIVVSNHGGRTIDCVPASLAMLPAIRQEVGNDYPLLLDSGIRSGADIFKAIALGADAVLIGRLQVYALAVAGALGVAHMLKLLRQELELCMATTGCVSIEDIKATKLHRQLEV